LQRRKERQNIKRGKLTAVGSVEGQGAFYGNMKCVVFASESWQAKV
jgi:hypothetical protein